MKNTQKMTITGALALLGAAFMLTGCGGQEEITTDKATPIAQVEAATPAAPADVVAPVETPEVVQEQPMAIDPKHLVTSLTDPGRTDLSNYRKLESNEDFTVFFYGLADFEVPVNIDGYLNGNKHGKEIDDIRREYRYTSETFAKMDLEERYAKVLSQIKGELGDNTLATFEISPRDGGFDHMLKPFDMSTKSFTTNFPGMNEGNYVEYMLIFDDNSEVAVINTGKIDPIVVEDMALARKIENEGYDIGITFYGAVSRVELINEYNHNILLVPHRIDVINLNNKQLIHSYEF